MKWILPSIVMMSLASGCSMFRSEKPASVNSGALDPGTPSAQPAQYQPAQYQPAQYQPAPVAVQPVYDTGDAQPVVAAAPMQASVAPARGAKYTVKKGDTLWKIAQTRYGNGSQWQKIASANPGLSAETLKAGQKITIP